ncbi:helix-turn-helix domain-containing protein, partial [bacterium]|nr:helix-turn-helix domain-containing protein [bacterium]
NELTEETLEEYYSKLRAHGGQVFFNGAVLKQIRELKSITLDELAKITCIRITYLKAIEDEDFKKFTSEIYLKGYLICYVEAMNLPLEQIIEEYIHLYNNHREAEKG